MLEIDVRLNSEVESRRRKYVFDLSRFSICSQVLQESTDNEFQIPHFSSITSTGLSTTHVLSEDPSPGPLHRNVICPLDNPSCSKAKLQEEFYAKNCGPEVSNLSHWKYILKHLAAFISVERPMNGPLSKYHAWAGNGSFSGFDITLSLSEMKVSNGSSMVFLFKISFNTKFLHNWVLCPESLKHVITLSVAYKY